MVADDIAFVGSFNLSRSGERNAENVLEIHDAAIADRLAAFVDEIRARYPPRRRPEDRTGGGVRAAFGEIGLVATLALPSRSSLGTAAASASRPCRRRLPARSSRPTTPWNRRVDKPAGRARLGRRRSPRSASTTDDARRLRLRALGRRPDRDPDHRRRHGTQRTRARPLRVRGRVRPRPVPDPARTSRSRAAVAPTATGTR